MSLECGQGKYSKSGYEPCKLCPRDTYQDSHGATSCISCPKGGKTWFRGADGGELCWGMICVACNVVKVLSYIYIYIYNLIYIYIYICVCVCV